MGGIAKLRGALRELAEAIATARAERTTVELPKRTFYDAMGTPAEAWENPEWGKIPPNLGSQFREAMRNARVGLRGESALPAHSDLAHYDLTGGEQLPHLPKFWRAGHGGLEREAAEYGAEDLPDIGLAGLRTLRLLDLKKLPLSKMEYHDRDIFLSGDEGSRTKGVTSGFGLYPNQGEGPNARWAAEQLKNRGPLSVMQLLLAPEILKTHNTSLYVPRASELHQKPLVLMKSRGGSV